MISSIFCLFLILFASFDTFSNIHFMVCIQYITLKSDYLLVY